MGGKMGKKWEEQREGKIVIGIHYVRKKSIFRKRKRKRKVKTEINIF